MTTTETLLSKMGASELAPKMALSRGPLGLRSRRCLPHGLSRESSQQLRPIGTPESGARIPSRTCAKGAVVALSNVVKSRRFDRLRVDQRVEIPDWFSRLLIDERHQRCPQRRNRAGAAEHSTLAIDENVIPGVWVGIAGDIRHTSPAPGNAECALPGWKREHATKSAATGSSTGLVVPDRFFDDLIVRSLQCGATTAQYERIGGRKVHVVIAVIHSVGRAIVTRGHADGYTHGRSRLESFVIVSERLRCPLRLG
jgi:hypothetical protein